MFSLGFLPLLPFFFVLGLILVWVVLGMLYYPHPLGFCDSCLPECHAGRWGFDAHFPGLRSSLTLLLCGFLLPCLELHTCGNCFLHYSLGWLVSCLIFWFPLALNWGKAPSSFRLSLEAFGCGTLRGSHRIDACVHDTYGSKSEHAHNWMFEPIILVAYCNGLWKCYWDIHVNTWKHRMYTYRIWCPQRLWNGYQEWFQSRLAFLHPKTFVEERVYVDPDWCLSKVLLLWGEAFSPVLEMLTKGVEEERVALKRCVPNPPCY